MSLILLSIICCAPNDVASSSAQATSSSQVVGGRVPIVSALSGDPVEDFFKALIKSDDDIQSDDDIHNGMFVFSKDSAVYFYPFSKPTYTLISELGLSKNITDINKSFIELCIYQNSKCNSYDNNSYDKCDLVKYYNYIMMFNKMFQKMIIRSNNKIACKIVKSIVNHTFHVCSIILGIVEFIENNVTNKDNQYNKNKKHKKKINKYYNKIVERHSLRNIQNAIIEKKIALAITLLCQNPRHELITLSEAAFERTIRMCIESMMCIESNIKIQI